MCQCMEYHLSSLFVQIHLIGQMNVLCLEFEGDPLVVSDHLWIWYLCLEECHMHSALLGVECR